MDKKTAAATIVTESEQVKNKLAEYGADESTIEKIINELGADTLDDLASLEANDLTSAGMKLAKARRAESFRQAQRCDSLRRGCSRCRCGDCANNSELV